MNIQALMPIRPARRRPPESHVRSREVLDVKGRFCLAWGMDRGRLHNDYWPRLNDGLRARVERVMAERHAALSARKAVPAERDRR